MEANEAAVRVAAAIGAELIGRMPHGEGAGAYEVRTPDGTSAVLKIGGGESSESPLVAALRARGYPIPAIIVSGTTGGIAYEVTERVDGVPMDQATAAQLPAIRAIVAGQRTIGLGSGDWIGHMVTSVTDGCTGYCEHAAMRAHSDETRRLLDGLRRLADGRRDVSVPTGDAVHYDFSPYNVLVRDDGIAGVVDWGDARLGDASFDLVTLAFYTYDGVVRDALLAAASASTPPRATELYVAHMVLRQVDWSLRHQTEMEVEWFMGVGDTLLARVAT